MGSAFAAFNFASSRYGHVYNGAVGVPVGMWTGSWRYIVPNVTQSDNPGGTLYFPTIQENSWEFRVVRDDTFFPEAIGLGSGTIIASLYFGLGNTGFADYLQYTTIENLQTECNAETGEVVRVTVSGKGGVVTHNVATPIQPNTVP